MYVLKAALALMIRKERSEGQVLAVTLHVSIRFFRINEKTNACRLIFFALILQLHIYFHAYLPLIILSIPDAVAAFFCLLYPSSSLLDKEVEEISH